MQRRNLELEWEMTLPLSLGVLGYLKPIKIAFILLNFIRFLIIKAHSYTHINNC